MGWIPSGRYTPAAKRMEGDRQSKEVKEKEVKAK